MFELGVSAAASSTSCSSSTTRARCCSCRWRTSSRGSSRSARQEPGPARPQRRHQEPGRRPRGVQADVHPGRAAGVREGLQHREPAGVADGAARSSTRRGRHRDRLQPGPGPQRARARCCGRRHAALRPAGLLASCAPRSAAARSTPSPAARRSATRLAPLLPRHRPARARGLRPHRDHRRARPSTSPTQQRIGTVGRPIPGTSGPGRRRRRAAVPGRPGLPRLLEQRRRRPPRRSTRRLVPHRRRRRDRRRRLRLRSPAARRRSW